MRLYSLYANNTNAWAPLRLWNPHLLSKAAAPACRHPTCLEPLCRSLLVCFGRRAVRMMFEREATETVRYFLWRRGGRHAEAAVVPQRVGTAGGTGAAAAAAGAPVASTATLPLTAPLSLLPLLLTPLLLIVGVAIRVITPWRATPLLLSTSLLAL